MLALFTFLITTHGVHAAAWQCKANCVLVYQGTYGEQIRELKIQPGEGASRDTAFQSLRKTCLASGGTHLWKEYKHTEIQDNLTRQPIAEGYSNAVPANAKNSCETSDSESSEEYSSDGRIGSTYGTVEAGAID